MKQLKCKLRVRDLVMPDPAPTDNVVGIFKSVMAACKTLDDTNNSGSMTTFTDGVGRLNLEQLEGLAVDLNLGTSTELMHAERIVAASIPHFLPAFDELNTIRAACAEYSDFACSICVDLFLAEFHYKSTTSGDVSITPSIYKDLIKNRIDALMAKKNEDDAIEAMVAKRVAERVAEEINKLRGDDIKMGE